MSIDTQEDEAKAQGIRSLVLRTYQVIENLISNDANHVEGLFGCYRIDEHVAMYADEMSRVQNAVFILGTPLFNKIVTIDLDKGKKKCA